MQIPQLMWYLLKQLKSFSLLFSIKGENRSLTKPSLSQEGATVSPQHPTNTQLLAPDSDNHDFMAPIKVRQILCNTCKPTAGTDQHIQTTANNTTDEKSVQMTKSSWKQRKQTLVRVISSSMWNRQAHKWITKRVISSSMWNRQAHKWITNRLENSYKQKSGKERLQAF